MLNKVKTRWVVHVDLNCSFSNSNSVNLCNRSGDQSAIHILFRLRIYMYITVYMLMSLYFMYCVSSQDSVVEIAFIPGKGLFPSSTSLHNGVQRAAGNNYNSGRLKVHIRSPEVSYTLFQASKRYHNMSRFWTFYQWIPRFHTILLLQQEKQL